MKSSKVKTIVVECRMKDFVDTKEFNIDPEIFDDIMMEAATRYAYQHVKKRNSKIAPILTTWEKKNEKKIETYNSYYAIINAGFHQKAEIMRRNFIELSGIDLKNERVKSNGKPRQQNN